MKEYRTPSGRLAPHANMSDEDLDEFEQWAKEVENRYPSASILWFLVAIAALLLLIFL